uniref:Uncharacterized protein n=1 Tax=Chlamydomonas euryale TaxID=1486919 RepID=A0A7R9Z0N7_9CHLO
MGNHTITPKATFTIKDVGGGLNGSNFIGPGLTATYKLRSGRLAASAAISDRTVVIPISQSKVPLCKGAPSDIAKFRDVVLTCDYKLPKKGPIPNGVTLNSKLNVGLQHATLGLTYDGMIKGKGVTLKGYYTNSNNKFAGESTVMLNLQNKLNATFSQDALQTGKWTFMQGRTTVEPSYNFTRKAPAISLTRKIRQDALKATYDVKSEGLALEWQHNLVKLNVATKIGRDSKFVSILKPTVGVTLEKAFSV